MTLHKSFSYTDRYVTMVTVFNALSNEYEYVLSGNETEMLERNELY